MRVKRRQPAKSLKVVINAETWLFLRDLARDRKVTAPDLVRACIDQCMPDLRSGDIEVQDGSGDRS
jgi:hypothetical protein